MATILLTNYYNEAPLRIVQSEVPVGFELLALDRPGREAILERITEADYLLAGGRVRIDREMIDAAIRLKMVQRSGVGLDNIDQEALREKGIPLNVNVGVNARSVAEHTVMLMLGLLRRVTEVDAGVKAGRWLKHDVGIRCNDLFGKKVGLVGYGNIGSLVASLLQPFGVELLYNKTSRLNVAKETELGLRYVTLQQLFSESDIVSLHCPLSEDTRGMVNAGLLALMKTGSIIINTSRGRLIDESALIQHLKMGPVRAAGLDVFAEEPLPQSSQLRSMNNVLLTPHIAGITRETFTQIIKSAMGSILDYEKQYNRY